MNNEPQTNIEDLEEIEISKKFQPLFDLLDARDIVKSKQFKKLSEKSKKYWTNLTKIDTVIITGGRDSAKSFTTSLFSANAITDYQHRILFTRYTMSSTDESIISSVKNRIELLELNDYVDIQKQKITSKTDKGKIVFTGIKTSSGNQSAKLKSLEDFSMFILEEGEEMKSFEEWDKIRKSIRSKDVQPLSIIVLNPTTTEHWIYEEFFQDKGVQSGSNTVKDNVLYIHVTYLDMKKEWIAESNLRDYEEQRKHYIKYIDTPKDKREFLNKRTIRKALYYKHVILGGWRAKAEGVIYENWEIGDFDYSLPYCYGLDYGFKDPLALVKIAIDKRKKRVYLDERCYKSGMNHDEVLNVIASECYKKDLIVDDHNEPRTRQAIKSKGYNIKKALKGKGSIVSNIRLLQSYTMIVTPTSKNLIRELNNRVWSDRKGEVPEDGFDHALNAAEYGVAYMSRKKRRGARQLN